MPLANQFWGDRYGQIVDPLATRGHSVPTLKMSPRKRWNAAPTPCSRENVEKGGGVEKQVSGARCQVSGKNKNAIRVTLPEKFKRVSVNGKTPVRV